MCRVSRSASLLTKLQAQKALVGRDFVCHARIIVMVNVVDPEQAETDVVEDNLAVSPVNEYMEVDSPTQVMVLFFVPRNCSR